MAGWQDVAMIDLETRGPVTIVRLAHGKANALDLELCASLANAFQSAPGQALVLTGTGSIFCAGVDLVRIVDGGPAYIRDFLRSLCDMIGTVLRHPRPVVAAVNGHAIAGGCVLAAACDRRILARGEAKIGVTEIRVGVAYPTVALELLRALLPGAAFQEAVQFGWTYPPEAALQRGFVDELADPAQLLDRSLEVARTLAALPPAAFAATKLQVRRPILQAPADPEAERLWESEETLRAVREYVRTVLKK